MYKIFKTHQSLIESLYDKRTQMKKALDSKNKRNVDSKHPFVSFF